MGQAALLKKIEDCEYPGEFLAARLHGKRGGLFKDWMPLVFSASPMDSLHNSPFYRYIATSGSDTIWQFLHDEHIWVYTRMNRKIRQDFEPYFIYHEMNSLIKYIRYLHCNCDVNLLADQLHYSLIHQEIQKILLGKYDFKTMLKALENHLVIISGIFNGLASTYEKKGIKALEEFIRRKLFLLMLVKCRSSMLRTFLQYMVDFHNSILLAKNIRWQIKHEPVFLEGGLSHPQKLKKNLQLKDLRSVLWSFPLPCLAGPDLTPDRVEVLLLSAISKQLRRWAALRTVSAVILYYLWEQFRYIRNISIVLRTAQVDDEAVSEKIII